jgi:hypothetical protein
LLPDKMPSINVPSTSRLLLALGLL